MSRFRPLRASSPLRPSAGPAVVLPNDILDQSHSTPVAIPELVGLTPEEVDFIEEVIERAPATATTFLLVFKAYNDILKERGLDPHNEVVYYNRLLKLGTLKGKNVGEKWAMVKAQQGYVVGRGKKGGRTTRVTRATPISSRTVKRPPPAPQNTQQGQESDAFTLHSHQDETDTSEAEQPTETAITAAQYHHTPRPLRRLLTPTPTITSTNSLGLDTGPPSTASYHPLPTHANPIRRAIPIHTGTHWDAETTEITESATQAPSSTPPSYGAATRGVAPMRPTPPSPPHSQMKSIFKRAMSSSPPLIEPAPLHRTISQPRERRNSVINEDDAWKKIKTARDEQEADRFRQERLVDRCWEVWKQGYQWIITTHEQIAEARDHLILRLALRRWHNLTISRREIYQRVSALSNRRCLKVALNLWEDKLKEKRQAQWRDNMRSRMREVREKRELKLKKDAWAKWRQSYRSHLSEQHYSERLVLRFLKRWQAKVHRLDELDAAAEHFMYAKEEAQIERCWNIWQHAMDMRRAENEMKARVALRVMAEAMVVWKKRIRAYQVADEFYDVVVVKRALGAWKASRDRIRALEHRATKHLTRQNDVLVRAVMRVWKAHERGKLMEGVRTHKLLKQAWVVWKQRMRDRRGQEDLALAFSMRSSSALASASLQKWRQAFLTHRNAQTFAVHYHSAQVQYKTLLVWRLQLRVRLKMNRQAKVAHKFFLMRSCWHKLIIKVEERRRESKLKAFEVQITKRFFKEWLDRTQRQRERKLAEEIMKQRISTRIMMDALAHWTNRVADLKFSELEVTQRYENATLASAFKKWKALCIRHVEELSLMESYQDVKREENMRRMFYRWLAAARKSRHRRLYLQQKEDEMKLTAVAAAWDRWRERFQDIRLQPIADDFIIQHQKNLMFRAFGIWHSKTRSLPAVRFHASHAKAKFWHIWREAMPRALQAKAAREVDRKSVLSKALDKWLHTYRTKIELKAVARARYLRLPTAAPRHTTQNARPPTALLSASRSSFLTRSGRSTDGNDPGPGPAPAPARPSAGRGKFGIASLLTSKPPERVERPRLSSRGSAHATSVRAPSPTQSVSSSYGPGARGGDGGVRVKRGPASVAGGEVARSSLWQELREVRRKSRPLANRSEAGEPP